MSFEQLELSISEQECVLGREKEENVTCTIPTPFPQRLWAPKNGTTNAESYKLFEQVKINIPLLDAIKQIPAYAKFFKDLCTIKCTIQVKKNIFNGTSKFHYSNQDCPKV